MTTLIVQLPPRDPTVPSQEWRLPPMSFILLDKRGRTLRAGQAMLATLPRASATVLLVAARDVLMLGVAVPPLKGPRLRQALPNVIEDQLIQDAQTCHIAIDPTTQAVPLPPVPSKGAGKGGAMLVRRVVAVIDRGWFRFVHEAFTAAGHRALRAVPITRCLPQPTHAPVPDAPGAIDALDALDASEPTLSANGAAPATAAAASGAGAALSVESPTEAADDRLVAAILGAVVPTDPALPDDLTLTAHTARIEIAMARGPFGEGLAVPAEALGDTLAALLPGGHGELYRLTEMPGIPGEGPAPRSLRKDGSLATDAIDAAIASLSPAPLALPFETLARNALACRFDLCQFEFAPQPWHMRRDTFKRARLPLALALATFVVTVIGVNVQWMLLAHQRDAINTRMTELLLSTFPKTTAVLDAPTQMTRQLDVLRSAAGELSPSDFLTLADGLSRSLGPVPPNALASLDYQQRALDVTFKPGTKIDDAFAQRLARNGLAGSFDGTRWTIRSLQ